MDGKGKFFRMKNTIKQLLENFNDFEKPERNDLYEQFQGCIQKNFEGGLDIRSLVNNFPQV